MLDKFNYSGKFSKTYQYWKYDSVLSSTQLSTFCYSKDITTPVSAFSYSNVDAFGAQVLCWHKSNLSNILTSEIPTQIGDDYSYISAEVMKDASSVGNEGWMSINTRYLKPF